MKFQTNFTLRLCKLILKDSFFKRTRKIYNVVLICVLILFWSYLVEFFKGTFANKSVDDIFFYTVFYSVGIQTLLFFLGFYWLMSALFFGKNINILLSLPLSKTQIVGAHFLPVLIRAYILEGILVLPAFYVNHQLGILNLYNEIQLTALFLVFPIIVLEITLFLLLLLFRYLWGKSRIWVIAVSGTLLLLLSIWFRRSNWDGKEQMIAWIGFPLTWGFIFLFAIFFILINRLAINNWWLHGRERAASNQTAHGYKSYLTIGKSFASKLSVNFVIREWKNFFRMPVYVTNYLATATVGMVIWAFLTKQLTVMKLQIGIDGEVLNAIIMFFMVFLLSLSMSSTLIAVSRDGKEWWALRALPISIYKILQAKWIANCLQDIVAILPAVFIAGFLFPTVDEWRGPLLILTFFSIVIQTSAKLIIDGIWPDFSWSEPIQPLRSPKRYLSYAVNLFLLFIYGGIGWGIGFVGHFPLKTVIWIVIGCQGITLLILLALIRAEAKKAERYSSKWFSNLS